MIPTLTKNFKRLHHPFCAGFDPDTSNLHPFLKTQMDALPIESFLTCWYKSVADGVGKTCGAIKFQSAFFESWGAPGIATLRDLIMDSKRRGFYTILDAKRGDISNTMKAYGQFGFDYLGADALTVLPWMGRDVIEALLPWLQRGRGVYTVWLSSNPAGRVVQTDAFEDGTTVASRLLRSWEDWAGEHEVSNQVGYVLGATDIPLRVSKDLANRHQSLLMPGIGAQGATLTDELRSLIKEHPATLLPVSRGILQPDIDASLRTWDDYRLSVESRWQSLCNEWQKNSDILEI